MQRNKKMLPTTKKKLRQRLKVVIEVLGGVAYVLECPDEVYVEIIDLDDKEFK